MKSPRIKQVRPGKLENFVGGLQKWHLSRQCMHILLALNIPLASSQLAQLSPWPVMNFQVPEIVFIATEMIGRIFPDVIGNSQEISFLKLCGDPLVAWASCQYLACQVHSKFLSISLHIRVDIFVHWTLLLSNYGYIITDASQHLFIRKQSIFCTFAFLSHCCQLIHYCRLSADLYSLV